MGRRHWALIVAARRYADEQLHERDRFSVAAAPAAPGEPVALVAATDPQVLFGLGLATSDGEVAYVRRLVDDPPVLATTYPEGVVELTEADYGQLVAGALAAVPAPKPRWLVSVSLPIEAASPAEAVREFWSYVDALGPRELPAFVSPSSDELAMQAFVLDEETSLDPEED